MAVLTETYIGDGSNKLFTPSTKILSESHCRVDLNYTDDGADKATDHLMPTDTWDLANNSIIMRDAPADGVKVKITVSTDGEGLDVPPSTLADLMTYKDELLAVHNKLDSIETLSTDLDTVDNVNSNMTDLNTVVTMKDEVSQVASDSDKLQTVIDSVNALNDNKAYNIYFHGTRDTDPVKRIDGGSLRAGDQYYSSTAQRLKVYDGKIWTNASGSLDVKYFYGLTVSDDRTQLVLTKISADELEEVVADDFLYWIIDRNTNFKIDETRGCLLIINNF